MEMSENRKVRKNSDARIFRRNAKRGKGERICRSFCKALPAMNGRERKEEK
jgi:hypothetical protein